MSFEAKFYQACAECGENVKGTQALYRGNDLVHETCPDDLDRDAKRSVCESCWLLKPCGCEQ